MSSLTNQTQEMQLRQKYTAIITKYYSFEQQLPKDFKDFILTYCSLLVQAKLYLGLHKVSQTKSKVVPIRSSWGKDIENVVIPLFSIKKYASKLFRIKWKYKP